jgi:hypothetical protein
LMRRNAKNNPKIIQNNAGVRGPGVEWGAA